MRVALTTHVNADGDGCGSVVALWHLLVDMGVRAAITNPTPFPKRYSFLLEGADGADKSREAQKHVERADAIIVFDISDLGRLGHLGCIIGKSTASVACIDHHASVGTLPEGPWLVDPFRVRDRRTRLRPRPICRLDAQQTGGTGSLRCHDDRHREFPVRQYHAACHAGGC